MHKFAILSVMVLGACSGDTGTGKSNNGGSPWTFDVGFDGAAPTDGAANNGSANNGTPGNNGSTNSGFFDIGFPPQDGGEPDASVPPDASEPFPDSGASLDAGATCTVNSDCGPNLFCCQGFDGQATCTDQCFSGGLCGGNDAECGRGEECCDLSQANLPDTCLDRCRGGGGGGGNMGTPCTTNPDCTGADEVCCPGFDGSGTCEPADSCFTGGSCAQDADCEGQQLCCDFNVAKVCLDRCNF